MAEILIDDITKVYSVNERLYETDEENIIILKVRHEKALLALQLVHLYE